MDILAYDDYKVLIKDRVKEIQARKKSFTLKRLASIISIQNTYLSRVLNDQKAHLSEDQLFALCRPCEFSPEETEYVCLLRNRSASSDPERRRHLESRIERFKKQRGMFAENQDFATSRMRQEMRYLFDPIAILVLASLDLPGVQKNPFILCARLGVSEPKLREVLQNLANIEMLELEEGGAGVKKVLKNQIHYGTDHPLMRVHQNLLRTALNSKLLSTQEEDKRSVMATFTADPEAFEKIKAEFTTFLGKVEGIVSKSRKQATYQLAFDLFKWI